MMERIIKIDADAIEARAKAFENDPNNKDFLKMFKLTLLTSGALEGRKKPFDFITVEQVNHMVDYFYNDMRNGAYALLAYGHQAGYGQAKKELTKNDK